MPARDLQFRVKLTEDERDSRRLWANIMLDELVVISYWIRRSSNPNWINEACDEALILFAEDLTRVLTD